MGPTERSAVALFMITSCLFLSTPLAAEKVTIGDADAIPLTTTTMNVYLQNDTEVEGFVLAIGYDTAVVSVTDVSVDGTATDDAGAELVVAEIFDAEGGFTLAVVLDSSAPFDGQTIAASIVDQTIATFDVQVDSIITGFGEEVEFTFEDGTFNTPILDNILVQGGASISIVDDIENESGTLSVFLEQFNNLYLSDGSYDPFASDPRAQVEVTLENEGAVQGFVLAVEHDPDVLALDAFDVDGVADSVGAEFVVPNLYDDGGTLAVVLDFDAPYDGQTIPVSFDNHIATLFYTPEIVVSPLGGGVETDVAFVNDKFGTPTLDNVIVFAGLSFRPGIDDIGTVTIIPPPLDPGELYCGVLDDEGEIVDVEVAPGGTAKVSVFYTHERNVQGLQIAMRVCAEGEDDLCFVADSFTTDDTIVDEVGVEYVNQSQDCDPDDGDGVEQTIGILLDALPPFEDQTLPQTSTPLAIGCFEITLSEDAECNTCYCIEFVDGVDAGEAVALDNLFVIDFEGKKGFVTNSCNICVVAPPEFQRGDCNNDLMTNIADAASMLGLQFQGLAVDCQDACDANDDGKVNLADTVTLLNYLFKSGTPPPDPGPTELGPDPTADDLGCENGLDPCS